MNFNGGRFCNGIIAALVGGENVRDQLQVARVCPARRKKHRRGRRCRASKKATSRIRRKSRAAPFPKSETSEARPLLSEKSFAGGRRWRPDNARRFSCTGGNGRRQCPASADESQTARRRKGSRPSKLCRRSFLIHAPIPKFQLHRAPAAAAL